MTTCGHDFHRRVQQRIRGFRGDALYKLMTDIDKR